MPAGDAGFLDRLEDGHHEIDMGGVIDKPAYPVGHLVDLPWSQVSHSEDADGGDNLDAKINRKNAVAPPIGPQADSQLTNYDCNPDGKLEVGDFSMQGAPRRKRPAWELLLVGTLHDWLGCRLVGTSAGTRRWISYRALCEKRRIVARGNMHRRKQGQNKNEGEEQSEPSFHSKLL
jgi:hypothetical protein